MDKTISLNRFISHFCRDKRAEKRFCFILGAGASKTSGIDTGGMMARQWIQELEESDKEDLETWLTEKKIQRDDYATHYSDIFDKRFELSRKDGFAFLENAMKGAEPSCGYSVLAQILADNKHNIVITTNFDSLTEDALFIYTEKKPLVIGHAALANYIATNLTRPLVVKIHHDLFLSPKNGTGEIDKLDENFTKNLKDIFKFYTPLVIGYGGNDGSLMKFLQGLEHIEEGLFWFYLDDKELKPNIKELVNKVNGHFVQIKGFDDLMIRLGDKLGHKSLDVTIENVAKRRADSYRKQIEKLSQNQSTDKDTKKAVGEITSRGDISWWSYELLAREEKNPEKVQEIYERGIKEFPKSSELMGNYANFLSDVKKDYVKAEKYYQKALELDANDAIVNGNYASFLCDIKKDHIGAEKYHQKALELNANDARVNGNYANFLFDIKKDYIGAEKYYQKALELDSNNARVNGNYANLLFDIKKDYIGAEKYYQKALELDANSARVNSNYANFLCDIKRDYAASEKYYQKALELDANDANINGNYANFLNGIRKDYVGAENYYQKALELNANDAIVNGNYAVFLSNIKKDYIGAERYYQKALELDANDTNINGNYANFLCDMKKDTGAEKYYQKVLELNPDDADFNGNYVKYLLLFDRKEKALTYINRAFELNKKEERSITLELWFYCYAVFPKEFPKSKEKIKKLLAKGIRSIGWELDGILEIAEREKHSNISGLRKFAKQISGEE